MKKRTFSIIMIIVTLTLITAIKTEKQNNENRYAQFVSWEQTEHVIPKIEGNGWFYLEGK